MRLTRSGFLLAAWLLLPCAAALSFEPLFYVVKTDGACTALKPGDKVPAPVQRHLAYPPETRFQTGPGGHLTIEVGERNSFTLASNATATVCDSNGNRHWKVIKLEEGYMTAALESRFDNGGQNRFTVETPSSVAEPTSGGEYEFIVTAGEDQITSSYRAIALGELKVYDNLMFMIQPIKHEARAEVSVSRDRQFTRFRNLHGKVPIELLNLTTEEGGPKILETQPDGIVKMWKNLSPVGGIWTVEILVVSPEGGLVETARYEMRKEG